VPTANPDHATTLAGEPVVIPVLDNDIGEGLYLVGLTQPSNGSIGVQDGSLLVYTPAAGFVGLDSFTYSISDAAGGFDSAVVTVEVLTAQVALEAEDDVATTPRDTPVTIDILANDTHPPDVVVSLLAQPATGEVQLDPDHTVTYTPPPGFVGAAGFGYAIEDAEGTVAVATVTVVVEDDNQPPSADPVAVATSSGSVVAVDVLAAASDPDGDALSVAALGPAAAGSVALGPDQTVAYQSDPGFVGLDRFLYTVGDGRGGFASGLVTVEVEEAVEENQPPVASDLEVTTGKDTPVTIDVLAHAVDPDGDPLTVAEVSAPSNGAAVIDPEGTVTYTPDPGFVGQDAFAYTVVDDKGGSDSAVVTIEVLDGGGEPFSDGTLWTDGTGWLG
jgi:large repetitive protein